MVSTLTRAVRRRCAALRPYGSRSACTPPPFPSFEFPEPTYSEFPTSAALELTAPANGNEMIGFPVLAAKTRSEGGAWVPAKTTPFATDDAPTPGDPFCCHATLSVAGSKACIVGCCTTVSRGSDWLQTPFGLPTSPNAVAP